MLIVYKVTNILNNKIYIGITTQSLNKRRKGHEHAWNRKHVTYFDKMLHDEGLYNFKWEIIDESAKNLFELSNLEKYYIKKYNSFYDTGWGYNRTTGGQTSFKMSEESKKLLSDSQKGELNHMYGKTGKLNPASKMVYNVTDDIIYENGVICINEENLPASKLYAVCRGERQTVKGKVYRYIDEEGNILKDFFTENKIYNLTTGKSYYFFKEIQNHYLEKDLQNLRRRLNEIKNKPDKFIIHNGEIWTYNPNVQISSNNLVGKRSKLIKNLDTNEIFLSLREASLSIGRSINNSRNLANKLRKNNGECIWNKYHWKEI